MKPTVAAALALLALCAGCAKEDGDRGGAAAGPTASALVSAPAPAGAQDEALRSVAKDALAALKCKDVEAIARLVPADKQQEARQAFASGGAAARSFYDETGWRWKSLAAWDGKVGEARVARGGERAKARVKYGAIDGREAAVVQLAEQGGRWYFDDLKSPSLESYATWGELVR
ncbi:MAG: hypothetical protein HY744_11640 [Deltaproteobacteria bacterium]|nr:hypothetical protein [Deltaproteobacteria bacterium]